MVRTEVELTDEEAHRLESLAKAEGTSVADCIRKGIHLVLKPSSTSREVRERAKKFAGRFRSKEGDLSIRHDDIFAEASEE